MNKIKNQRDYKIDILRFIAIVCIILAHTTNLPITIRIFRNFDVTLMVMIMGTSYYLSSNGKDRNYLTYYLSYGIFMSLLLLIVLDIKCIYNIFDNEFVRYISKNSLWLYLWHIIPIYILEIYGNFIPILNSNFIIQFMFIFVFAFISTKIHQKIKDKFFRKFKNYEINI